MIGNTLLATMKAILCDDLEVRPFVEGDRYAVASLHRDVLREFDLANDLGSLSGDMSKITRRYVGDTAGFWVLKYETLVIGTVGLRPHGEFTAEIERLYLKKRYRGRGIGRKLLKFIEDWAYKTGYRRLFASCPRVMEKGKSFLEHAKYRIVGNESQDVEEDLFEKELF
jgi:putative acetyltransferase